MENKYEFFIAGRARNKDNKKNNDKLEFTGKCIAIIYRINEDDDKLILVPNDIEKLTYFSEKYHESFVYKQ